jgi:hypothetical protein
MSSANDEGDDELREGMAKSKARAQWGGAAVVFGLVIEVVLAAAYPNGPVFADALVALGVASEILFAAKARSKSETLQRRYAAYLLRISTEKGHHESCPSLADLAACAGSVDSPNPASVTRSVTLRYGLS